MDLQYKKKTALVTGASSGLGRAVAERLAQEGAHVFLVARREELLREVAQGIVARGGSAEVIACDLATEDSHSLIAKRVKEESLQLHLLVNNAGQELFMPLQATSLKAIHELVQLNFISVASLIKSCLGLLKDGSAVVNMSSASAIQGAAGLSIYSATKGALICLTKSLARELAPRKVRVNAVAPGQVRTELLTRTLARLKPEQQKALEAAHPLGFGNPDDVAAAVAFMGSAQAKWITGQVLVVDGGLTA